MAIITGNLQRLFYRCRYIVHEHKIGLWYGFTLVIVHRKKLDDHKGNQCYPRYDFYYFHLVDFTLHLTTF